MVDFAKLLQKTRGQTLRLAVPKVVTSEREFRDDRSYYFTWAWLVAQGGSTKIMVELAGDQDDLHELSTFLRRLATLLELARLHPEKDPPQLAAVFLEPLERAAAERGTLRACESCGSIWEADDHDDEDGGHGACRYCAAPYQVVFAKSRARRLMSSSAPTSDLEGKLF